MKKYIIYFLLLSFTCLFSQKRYAKELSIKSDNDLYLSGIQDRYYTSGLYISYRYIGKNNYKKSLKKVYEFQLGHQMYTPFKSVVRYVEEHDRPFAGHLYAGFSISNFYKNNLIFKMGAKIGVIGPYSYSQEIMEAIHTWYGFNDVPGWDYQISSALALNLDATLIKNFEHLSSSKFDISWYNKAKAGTIFTNLTTGLYARLGIFKLKELNNSIAFHGNLNKDVSKKKNNLKEAFFFIKPLVHYNLYDATIQGSFLNTSSPVTYKISPFSFSTELGVLFTLNKVHLGYTANLYSKRINNPKVPLINFYGSIYINYQFN